MSEHDHKSGSNSTVVVVVILLLVLLIVPCVLLVFGGFALFAVRSAGPAQVIDLQADVAPTAVEVEKSEMPDARDVSPELISPQPPSVDGSSDSNNVPPTAP